MNFYREKEVVIQPIEPNFDLFGKKVKLSYYDRFVSPLLLIVEIRTKALSKGRNLTVYVPLNVNFLTPTLPKKRFDGDI